MAIDERNRRAIAVLERAQRIRGVRSSTAFAREIAKIADGSPSATSYLRWLNGDAVIPAWALEAAAEAAGTTLAALLEEVGDVPADWRENMEDAVGRLQAEVLELRERLDAVDGSTRAEPSPMRSPAPQSQRRGP